MASSIDNPKVHLEAHPYFNGGREVAQKLVQYGHRRIASTDNIALGMLKEARKLR